jgi:polysaccharide biosynthesis protein PslH
MARYDGRTQIVQQGRATLDYRPRVLYVVRYLPYVPSPGYLTRTFHLVRAAAQVADLSLIGAPHDPLHARVKPLFDMCADVHVLDVPPGAPPPFINTLIHRARAVHARYPAARPLGTLLQRASALREKYQGLQEVDYSGLDKTVTRLLGKQRYDLVVVEHDDIADMLSDTLKAWGGPRIADLHSVMSVQKRRLEINRGREETSLSPLVLKVQAAERRILQSYDRVTVVSEADGAEFRQICLEARIEVVPNGVDVDYFGAVDIWRREGLCVQSEIDTLVFTGHLALEPNADAVVFFVREVLPLVRRRRPGSRFWIVGGGPVLSAVESLAKQPGVELFLDVDDVRPFLATSHVAVAPLRLGSGTRLKVLEALAAHTPLVSTTRGAEGLELAAERDLLVADTPASMAEAVVQLLERPDYAARIAQRGADTARKRYSWAISREKFQSMLLRVLAAQSQ